MDLTEQDPVDPEKADDEEQVAPGTTRTSATLATVAAAVDKAMTWTITPAAATPEGTRDVTPISDIDWRLFDSSQHQRWPSCGTHQLPPSARNIEIKFPNLIEVLRRGWPQRINQSTLRTLARMITPQSTDASLAPASTARPRRQRGGRRGRFTPIHFKALAAGGGTGKKARTGAGSGLPVPGRTEQDHGASNHGTWFLVRRWLAHTIVGNWTGDVPCLDFEVRAAIRLGCTESGGVLDWISLFTGLHRTRGSDSDNSFSHVADFAVTMQSAVVEAVRNMPSMRSAMVIAFGWDRYEETVREFKALWPPPTLADLSSHRPRTGGGRGANKPNPVAAHGKSAPTAQKLKICRRLSVKFAQLRPRDMHSATWLPLAEAAMRANYIYPTALRLIRESDVVECIQCVPELIWFAVSAAKGRIDDEATAAAAFGDGQSSSAGSGPDDTRDAESGNGARSIFPALHAHTAEVAAAICATVVRMEMGPSAPSALSTWITDGILSIYRAAVPPHAAAETFIARLCKLDQRAACVLATVCGIWERTCAVHMQRLDIDTTVAQIEARTDRVGFTSHGRDDWLLVGSLCKEPHTILSTEADFRPRATHTRNQMKARATARPSGIGLGLETRAPAERRGIGFNAVSIDSQTGQLFCCTRTTGRRGRCAAASLLAPTSARLLHPLPLTGRIVWFVGQSYSMCPRCGAPFKPKRATGFYLRGIYLVCDACALEVDAEAAAPDHEEHT